MKQFREEHELALGKDRRKDELWFGFPDCGSGRFAQKLSYEAWVKFNNNQRVHQNLVEQLPIMLTILLISGLILPKITMYVAFLNVGARLIYTTLYVSLGSDWRKLGGIFGGLPLNLLMLATIGILIYKVATE